MGSSHGSRLGVETPRGSQPERHREEEPQLLLKENVQEH
jgi:hypothetical protein